MPSGPKKRRAAAKKKANAIPDDNDKNAIITNNHNTTICRDSVDQQDGQVGSKESENIVQENGSNASEGLQGGHQATVDDDNEEDVSQAKYLEGSLSDDECIAKLSCIEEKVIELMEQLTKIKSSMSEVVLSIEILKASLKMHFTS